MPGRIVPLVNGEVYHIFNRGSDKREIFLKNRDFRRFRQTFHYYQTTGPKTKFSNFSKQNLNTFKPKLEDKLVDILCYCLMPNHFHFLLRQLKDNGIAIFMSQISNSYTRFFNTKYKRIGPLLQGAYKAVRIESDEQLLHVFRYILLNPVVSKLTETLYDYEWSAYSEYMQETGQFCSTKEILNYFPSVNKCKEFLENQIEYGQTLELIKHHLIDEE